MPIYFTVPKGIGGAYYWYAELNGGQTSKSAPVTVNVSTIAPTPGDITIVDICQYNQCFLRTFRYTHSTLPDNHFLVKWEYQGIKFAETPTLKPDTYIAMMADTYACAGLLEKNKLFVHVALRDKTYKNDKFIIAKPGNASGLPSGINEITTSKYDWIDSLDITESDITKAWNNGGLPILGIAPPSHDLQLFSNKGNLKYDYDLIAQDNFGNWLKFVMDWDYGGGYHKNWKVTEVQVIYPA